MEAPCGPSESEDVAGLFDRLWPLLRSITGEGVRHTHDILSEVVPLERIEIPSGTKVFDWTIPKEWIMRDAYVLDPAGRRILDVRENTLHLVNYSVPFRGTLTRAELDAHLHSLPSQPDAIPYVTSYYAARWGFCLSQRVRDSLPQGNYQVVVDTDLVDGSLTIGECVLPGNERTEVLFSADTCHPSMANNELSGPLAAAFLYRRLAAMPERRLTYRFVFLPETIGSIAYLSLRGQHLKERLLAGYVLTCVGDRGGFTYKRSLRGTSIADRAAEYALLRAASVPPKTLDFTPIGSDERQYCSPGFDLPVGSIMRTMYGEYPEYHTSLDNREFISFEAIRDTVDVCFLLCRVLEANRVYENLVKYGEPNLGSRGLYPNLGGLQKICEAAAALLWVTSMADGARDLLSIAERSGMDIFALAAAAQRCVEKQVLKIVDRMP